ncbi:hypothetical protein [Dyadobacter sp. CY326]|uniref:hypothetical protein n=1 Tax=Dyadobacter sp. CY326 TaxID=2907300 RepID=UPI001F19C43E|nr:hypothetical protein [Dyadobacter sp. CY326]MCE7065943.1 hypothetical protein [Dyadobacter sp. CY326]
MKRSIIFLGSAFFAGALAAAYVRGNQPKIASSNHSARVESANVQQAVRRKYIYDEMAHKLVAYSASEASFSEAKQGLTYKLGSRILKLTKKECTDQQLFML